MSNRKLILLHFQINTVRKLFDERITKLYVEDIRTGMKASHNDQVKKKQLAQANRPQNQVKDLQTPPTDSLQASQTGLKRSRKRLCLNEDNSMAISTAENNPAEKKPKKEPEESNLVTQAMRKMLIHVFGKEFIMSHSCMGENKRHVYPGLNAVETIQANAIKGNYIFKFIYLMRAEYFSNLFEIYFGEPIISKQL